jgi:hypothetical protein
MWKITITMKIIIILIIQYLSFKFILFRFYIWKITKTKSLNPVVKKWYPNCEYTLECLNSLVELLIELFQKMVVIAIFNCLILEWNVVTNPYMMML